MKRKSIAFRKRVIAIVSLAVLTVTRYLQPGIVGGHWCDNRERNASRQIQVRVRNILHPILNEGAYYNAENIEFGDYFLRAM